MGMIPKPKNPYAEIEHMRRCMQLMWARLSYMEEWAPIEQATMMQLTIDACAMANNDVFQMSVGRAKRWEDRVQFYLDEFDKEGTEEVNASVDYKGRYRVNGDEEIPATTDKIDRRISEIYGPAFRPYRERYHWDTNQALREQYKKFLEELEKEMKYIKGVIGGKR